MIFGLGYPKVVNGVVTLLLNYFNVEQDEPEWEYITHESILTGKKTVTAKGYHWVFAGTYNLYKQGNLAAIKTKYNEIIAQYNQSVVLYRHVDGLVAGDGLGDPIGTPTGSIMYFKMTEYRPFYLTRSDYKDCVYIKFISQDFIKLVVEGPPV